MVETKRLACAVVVALSALHQPAAAQMMSYNRWKIDATPYFWLSGVDGDVTVDGTTTSVDADFGDIAELISWGISGHVEARKRALALIFDLHYRELDEQQDSLSTTLQNVVAEGSAGYAVTQWLEVIGGVRYFNTEVGISGTPISENKNWVDPIVGGRATWRPAKAWTVSGRADVGGFGIGSDLSWSVTAVAAYRVYDFSVVFGYRIWQADYETGSGGDLFRYDVITHGPGLGMTFHFGGGPQS
jgi:hypothetical protein